MQNQSIEFKEKNRVALTSVFAAIVLTGFKLVVGLSTNSIGILSEAAHSGLDLVAAFITFIAIRLSSKPADEDHHFGHGKIENFSALIETILLLITCGWIIYEVIVRFLGKNIHIEITAWSFIVVFTSIIIDISRSRALNRVAKKYNSQALEADALHFSSDIYSSAVVLVGLIGYFYGFLFADSIAALIVAIIVIYISLKLGKRTIDELLDKAPKGIRDQIRKIIVEELNIKDVHKIKIRNSGSHKLIQLTIGIDSKVSVEEAHKISDVIEEKIMNRIEKSEVHIHFKPITK